jgi:diadenosine hexaphosphate hydrolase (ATP-forming)
VTLREAITAGGIVLKAIDGQLKIALARDPAEGDNAWVIPKGHVHEGESLETAAIREIRDEVGVQMPILICYLGFIRRLSVEDWGETVQKDIHLFLAYASGPIEIKPADSETVTESAWFTLRAALQVIPFKQDIDFLKRELQLLLV